MKKMEEDKKRKQEELKRFDTQPLERKTQHFLFSHL